MVGSLRGEDLAEETSLAGAVSSVASDEDVMARVDPRRALLGRLRGGPAFRCLRRGDGVRARLPAMRRATSTRMPPSARSGSATGQRAAAALAALDATGAHGRIVDVNRRTVRAGLAALEGRGGEALSAFREALAGWRDLGAPWREALTAITMATLLEPSDPEVRPAADGRPRDPRSAPGRAVHRPARRGDGSFSGSGRSLRRVPDGVVTSP